MSIDPEYISIALAIIGAICTVVFFVGKLFFSLWSAQKTQSSAIAQIKEKQTEMNSDFRDLNAAVKKVTDDMSDKTNELVQALISRDQND